MEKYKWTFNNIGGVTRVNITCGEDIAHLGELDQKLWTVLSCPVNGLEFDSKTLALMDTNGDGKIHVGEVVAAAEWLCAVLNDPDILIKNTDTLPLAAINQENEEGKKLYNSAQQILKNLGKADSDSISIADSSDSVAIFAKTQFNGDGIITPASADDETLKAVIAQVIATVGSKVDRSGEAGIDADLIAAFYTACADYAAWQDAATPEVLTFGDGTESALAACEALKDKISDYFMRCKLTAFASGKADALDVTAGQIEALSGKNLSESDSDIAACPLSHVTADAVLPYKGINPAWQGAFDALRTQVLDVIFPDADSLSEEQWQNVLARFGAYTAWKGAKKGDAVESLGIDAVRAVLADDKQAALVELVDKDKALTDEANSIDNVDKLMHLVRDFYTLLRNYVAMTDFYQSYKGDVKAIFQAGTLYIDQRSTDLCIRVADMGKHGDMAGLSGMFIIYCDCTSKVKGQTIQIAAVLTDGDVDALRPGTNAIFYDRDGHDWDAVITKIVDNPISVRQAFLRPYKKLANWITDKINKTAADKEAASTEGLLSKADTVSQNPADAAAKKPAFDIAKFAGIFGALSLGLGMLGTALVGFFTGIVAKWYYLPLLIVGIIVVISGPSMFIAWNKLRKRNLAPVLNANGWAINSKVLVNTRFGATMTKLAKYPKVNTPDPFAKKTPTWLKWLRTILLLLVVAFAVLFFTDSLKPYGLPFHKDKAVAEEVVEEAATEAEAVEEVPAEEAVAEEAAPEA